MKRSEQCLVRGGHFRLNFFNNGGRNNGQMFIVCLVHTRREAGKTWVHEGNLVGLSEPFAQLTDQLVFIRHLGAGRCAGTPWAGWPGSPTPRRGAPSRGGEPQRLVKHSGGAHVAFASSLLQEELCLRA